MLFHPSFVQSHKTLIALINHTTIYCFWWLVFLRPFQCSPRVVSMRQRCLQCWQVLFLHRFLIHIVCYTLCIVICFLVFLVQTLMFFSSPLRKYPECPTRCTTQVFIPLIRFLPLSFVSNSFVVLLIYSLLIFSFISTSLNVSASKIANICKSPFLRAF